MRKRLKKKLRSCQLCKPHKNGWTNRFKVKEFDQLRRAEQEIASTLKGQLTGSSKVL